MSDLPRVTQILTDLGFTNYRPGNERAMAVGRAVHKAVFLLERGTLDESRLHPDLQGPLDAYKSLRAALSLKVEEMEMALTHPQWGYTGHPDALARPRGDTLCLFDWKVSDAADLFSATLQLAAYKMLVEANRPETVIRACFVGRLGKDGSYSVIDVTSSEAENVFKAAVVVWRHRQKGNRL